MQHSKIADVIGTILLLTGMFLAFLPHTVHIAVGLDNETSHVKHVVTGMILVVLALAVLIYNNKSLKMPKKLQKHLY